jgi:hypothetical protein
MPLDQSGWCRSHVVLQAAQHMVSVENTWEGRKNPDDEVVVMPQQLRRRIVTLLEQGHCQVGIM